MLADQRRRHAGMGAEHLGEDIALVAEAVIADPGFLQIFEHPVGGLRLGVERVEIEFLMQAGQTLDAALIGRGGIGIVNRVPAAIGIEIIDPAELGL